LSKHIETYDDFHKVFDCWFLITKDNRVNNYQLIRNILAAYKYDLAFPVLLDSSRIDSIKEVMIIMQSIKQNEMKNRVNFLHGKK
jgi:hypothetical protein